MNSLLITKPPNLIMKISRHGSIYTHRLGNVSLLTTRKKKMFDRQYFGTSYLYLHDNIVHATAGAEDSPGFSSCSSFYLKNSVCCFSAIYAICHPSHAHKYIFMSFIMVLSKQVSSFNSALHKGSFAEAFLQYAFTY